MTLVRATHTRLVSRNFYPAFVTAVNARLSPLGFRKGTKALGIWMRPVASRISAWAGVAAAWYPENDGSLEVRVTVGVRQDVIESALSSLWPELADHTGATTINATVAINLQLLRPAAMQGVVYVNGPPFIEPAASTVADQIVEYGLPFASSLSTLPAVIDALRTYPFMSATDYRLPVALYLNGQRDAAAEALDAARERVAVMKGPIKENYEAFASEFFSRMATLPVQAE